MLQFVVKAALVAVAAAATTTTTTENGKAATKSSTRLTATATKEARSGIVDLVKVKSGKPQEMTTTVTLDDLDVKASNIKKRKGKREGPWKEEGDGGGDSCM